MKSKSLDVLRSLPNAELDRLAALVRTCPSCGNKFFAARDDALYCSTLCRVHSHRASRREDRPRPTAAEMRKVDKLTEAYGERFGYVCGTFITPVIQRAMARALKTGIDQRMLIETRRKSERSAAEYDRKHEAELAAEHAQPFTPKFEKHYTDRIRDRRLIEGDCERPWQNYFAYRDAHPDAVGPLTETDMSYVRQWTSAGTRRG